MGLLVLTILAAGSVGGCSSPSTTARTPAAAARKTVVTFRRQTASLISAHVLGQELVAEFDALLKNPATRAKAQSSKTYAKLLALKRVRDGIRENTVSDYADLYSAQENHGLIEAYHLHLQTLIEQASDHAQNRAALSDLVEQLAEIQEEKSKSTPMKLEGLGRYRFKVTAVKKNKQGRHVASTNEPGRSGQSVEAANLKEIQANVEDLATNVAEQFDTTPAPVLRLKPSAGPDGNIFGGIFPVGTWALTFDDGPSSVYTPTVLKNLADHDLHATFFVLAQQLKLYPNLAKAEQDAGMAYGNHSYTHLQLTKVDDPTLHHEIVDAAAVDTQVFGIKPAFMRLPYGAGVSVPKIRQMIADNGMIHVYWNVDTLDWQDHNPDTILTRATTQMEQLKRGVILFHDIHPQSVVASNMVMDYIIKNNLRPVTLPEIVDEINATPPPTPASQ